MRDDRTQNLIDASRRVLDVFRSGYHPTGNQLNRLDGALMAFDVMKMCGHTRDDDCDWGGEEDRHE